MNFLTIIIWIGIAVACAIIHKNKGYSPVSAFIWGLLISILELAFVLLEDDKEKHDMLIASGEKKEIPVWKWLLIFLSIGITLIVIFFVIMNML